MFIAGGVNALLVLPRPLDQLLMHGGDLLAALVAMLDSAEHFFFGRLLAPASTITMPCSVRRDDDIEFRRAAFRVSRIRNVLTIHHADANARPQVMERNVGNGERRARADDGEQCQDRFRDPPKEPWQ